MFNSLSFVSLLFVRAVVLSVRTVEHINNSKVMFSNPCKEANKSKEDYLAKEDNNQLQCYRTPMDVSFIHIPKCARNIRKETPSAS